MTDTSTLDATLGPAPLGKDNIYYVPYERPLVEAVDKLIDVARVKCSPNKRVESDGDWEVLDLLFKLYQTFYSQECQQFLDDMAKTRNHQIVSWGKRTAITKEGDAMMQQQLQIPGKFNDMLKAFFPLQPLTKPFVRKLWQKMPQFRVGDTL